MTSRKRWLRCLFGGLLLVLPGCGLLEDEFAWLDRSPPRPSAAPVVDLGQRP